MEIRTLWLLTCGLAACLWASPARASGPEDMRAQVDAIALAHLEQGGASSLAIGVHDHGREATFFYGDAGRDLGTPTADTLFELGSVTQVFTATILAAFAERGYVQLSDPLQQYAPKGVRVPNYQGQPIRLIDLATHTSGLPPDVPNTSATLTAERLWEFVNGYTLDRSPGTQYLYSKLGWALLGRALVKASGTSGYQELVQREILAPLGMRSTWLLPELPNRTQLAEGHRADGTRARYEMTSWPAFLPADGLCSSLDDMMKFLRFAMGIRETPLTPYLNQLEQPRYDAGPHVKLGLGWQIYGLAGSDVVVMAKNGRTLGFSTILAFVPSTGTGVVVLAGSDRRATQIGVAVLRTLNAGTVLPEQILGQGPGDDES